MGASQASRRPESIEAPIHSATPASAATRYGIFIGASSPFSEPGRGLPELDLVALRIHHPAELAELRFLDLVLHVATLLAKGVEERVQVVDAVVDHEGRGARREIVALALEEVPDGRPVEGLALRVDPPEGGTAPRLQRDAQVPLVPVAKRLRVLRLEEDAADARDPLHVRLPCALRNSRPMAV